MLQIYYRASNSDHLDSNPKYFSKLNSLKNFTFVLQRVARYKFTLFFDGTPDYEIVKEAKRVGNVEILKSLGNSGSFWHAYQKAIKLSKNDLVYFVEDDYLHVPDALQKLIECAKEIHEADYITLYDHPVRYAEDYHYGLDVPHRNQTIFLSSSHHWRTQESTCMTFASRAGVLKSDYTIFKKYVTKVKVPEDRELFKRLQGLAGYEKGSPFHLLIGPIPSLATHCHEPWFAPTVDWERVARETTNARV